MSDLQTDESTAETLGGRLLKRLKDGGSFVQEKVGRVEQHVLSGLKQRMDKLEQPLAQLPVSMFSSATPQQRQQSSSERKTPGQILRGLLSESSEQSQEQSIESACMAVLQSLVPDEARILAALSDGSGYAVISVMATSNLGITAVPMLEYVSTVGRSAGVLTPALTQAYVHHLAFWGLIETAPEDPTQTTNYDILETNDAVRDVLARIKKSGERGRIVRRTLLMSDLGHAMWNLCQADA